MELPAQAVHFREEAVDDEVINRGANSHVADKLVERRLTVKTDTEKYDLLMPLESVDSLPLNTVSTLFSDETGVETNPWNDDFGQTKILTILDDPKEVN